MVKQGSFVIGHVCVPQFVCRNIGFRVISFVWNWYDVNYSTFKNGFPFFWKNFPLFRKVILKSKVKKHARFLVIVQDADHWNGEEFWKTGEPFFRRHYALSFSFQTKSLRRSIFWCFDEIYGALCRKIFSKKHSLILIMTWSITLLKICTQWNYKCLFTCVNKYQKQPRLFFFTEFCFELFL